MKAKNFLSCKLLKFNASAIIRSKRIVKSVQYIYITKFSFYSRFSISSYNIEIERKKSSLFFPCFEAEY